MTKLSLKMRFRSFWLMNNDVKSRATSFSSPLHKVWRLQYMEKILLSLKELCEYTGWGETKVREILKRENSTIERFNVKNVLCRNSSVRAKFEAIMEK